jgi:hypothetical protein
VWAWVFLVSSLTWDFQCHHYLDSRNLPVFVASHTFVCHFHVLSCLLPEHSLIVALRLDTLLQDIMPIWGSRRKGSGFGKTRIWLYEICHVIAIAIIKKLGGEAKILCVVQHLIFYYRLKQCFFFIFPNFFLSFSLSSWISKLKDNCFRDKIKKKKEYQVGKDNENRWHVQNLAWKVQFSPLIF